MAVHAIHGCFDAVYVMYLPNASDRVKLIINEVKKLSLPESFVHFSPGLLFDEPQQFPSNGVRGCVMTFRAIFEDALKRSYKSILVLQDDCALSSEFFSKESRICSELSQSPWDFAYIGHGMSPLAQTESMDLFQYAPADQIVMLTHCCGYSCRAMSALCTAIDDSLSRLAGDSAGGPMYFDGYVNRVRKLRPELKVLKAARSFAGQYSSRSHLTPRPWDKILWLVPLIQLVRWLRNKHKGSRILG
jgi:glycosyl transferase, family 25